MENIKQDANTDLKNADIDSKNKTLWKHIKNVISVIIILSVSYILGNITFPLVSFKNTDASCYHDENYKNEECKPYEDWCIKAFRIGKCDILSSPIPYDANADISIPSGVV